MGCNQGMGKEKTCINIEPTVPSLKPGYDSNNLGPTLILPSAPEQLVASPNQVDPDLDASLDKTILNSARQRLMHPDEIDMAAVARIKEGNGEGPSDADNSKELNDWIAKGIAEGKIVPASPESAARLTSAEPAPAETIDQL